MRDVSIVGIAQVPVEKSSDSSLRELGASVVKMAMEDAGAEGVDALFASNMLADELQGQKHIAALIADEAGLTGIEALQVQATMSEEHKLQVENLKTEMSGAYESKLGAKDQEISDLQHQLSTHLIDGALRASGVIEKTIYLITILWRSMAKILSCRTEKPSVN